jgi:signal transduction histidine kinase
VSRWPLRRRLVSVFGVIGLVTLVIVILITSATIRLDHARRDRVDIYGPAVLSTETLAKSYSDQETGLRGYISAGDPSFLDPYTNGRAAERTQRRTLRRLLAHRPDLLQRLDAVTRAADIWRGTVAAPAIASTKADEGTNKTSAEFEAGKRRFDAIRTALTALQRPLAASRDTSSRVLDDSLFFLRLVLLFSLALLIVLGVLTWVALRRWVTAPLAELGAEVDTVEGGDLSHPVRVGSGPEEIRQLAEQVDRMRLRIVQEFALADQARDDAQRARLVVEEQALDLQRSNTELEQFAYVASHDLQEPLRKVASFCQLLERRYKGELDERGEQYIEFAVDGAKRMQQLINDLLAFSRVGRLNVEFAPVDLGEALAQAQRQLSAALEEVGATVTHDELPTINGDGSLLVQLFQNLVGNGIKFRGEDAPRVHIGVRRDGDMWELSCSDNGIGIEPQYADKIFVIFQRLHGRDVYGGTGIGLAMCKKIVEYHGGRMWLDTAVTDGATLRWTLPVASTGRTAAERGSGTSDDIERMSDDAVSASATD